jgi:mannose-6-phosphate isomerase-like protein (cupin superfamily)
VGTRFQSAELDDMLARARAAPDGYAAEVVRSGLLSVGLYTLGAGALDDQTPHLEDEVYYTVRGRATLHVDGDEHPVEPGSLLYVPAKAVHRFHDIVEELVLLVFWAPPEGSVTSGMEG